MADDTPTDELKRLLASFKAGLPLDREARKALEIVFRPPVKLERAVKALEERMTAAPLRDRPDRLLAVMGLVQDVHAGRRPADAVDRGNRRTLPWILSGQEPNLALTPVFHTALGLLGSEKLSARQLMGLVETFLQAPAIAEANYEPWVARIHRELGCYDGSFEPLVRWREHRGLLFTMESPKLIAQHCLDHPNGPAAAFAELALRRASAFGSRILLEIGRQLGIPPRFPGQVIAFPQLVTATRPGTGTEDEFTRDAVRLCIEKLLLAYHDCPSIPLNEGFGRIVFSRLGDPRMTSNVRWGQVDPRAVAVYRRWVAREDLELFFRAVTMDEDRRAFWLDYVDQMENSRVALGSAARVANQSAVHQFLRDGRAARLDGGGGTVSAFMFQIGHYHFVEFSETGNAAYVYRLGESPVSFEEARYQISALKHEIKHWKYGPDSGRSLTNRILHQSSWQLKARNLLRNLGIKPSRQGWYT